MSLLLFAVAVLLLPSTARGRLESLRGKRNPRFAFRLTTPLVVGAGALLGLLLGPAGAVSGVVLAAVLWQAHRVRAAHRADLLAADALAEGLRSFTTELRTGAHPAGAARAAAQDAAEPAATALTAIATSTARGGDVVSALAGTPAARLARAWRLADHHGVPLAEVLDTARADLERRTAFTRTVHARMAGPRTSAAVLAALPVLGVLLGQLSGTSPLSILRDTLPGQALLLVGVLLLVVGLRWSAGLTGSAA
ncbi:type II secretion system F family protein [Actinosynnema sp.]|uniref:type II secretion system F family protein n=1 Tax=Actinosynnema sp. TaxID=1872144 RepID=UPI003F86A9F3